MFKQIIAFSYVGDGTQYSSFINLHHVVSVEDPDAEDLEQLKDVEVEPGKKLVVINMSNNDEHFVEHIDAARLASELRGHLVGFQRGES